jgi:predicted lipoprotein with Yx(FWY)xxD motif
MIRRPVHRLAATLAVLGLAAVPIASASAAAAGAAKVSLKKTALGMILVNGRGRTLYGFTKDAKNKDRCVTIAGCPSTWLVVTSRGKPTAGPGVNSSKLSTVTLTNGSHQVTYAGHPLYTYSGDSSAGETDYVGASQFGGTWLAVNGAGKLVK